MSSSTSAGATRRAMRRQPAKAARKIPAQPVDEAVVAPTRSAQAWVAIAAPYLAASLLLLAAVLKAFQLIHAPAADLGSVWRWHQLVLEWLFGWWLASGLARGRAVRGATVLFGIFACVAIIEGFRNQASCDCFGAVQVNPWGTATMDAIVVAALGTAWRRGGKQAAKAARWRIAILTTAIFATVVLSLSLAQQVQADHGTSGDSVYLNPESWVGHPLPIADHLDMGSALKHGQWVLLLYRQGCPACTHALSELVAQASADHGRRYAAVVLNGHVADSPYADSLLSWANFTDGAERFATPGTIVQLSEGIVTGTRLAEDGPPSLAAGAAVPQLAPPVAPTLPPSKSDSPKLADVDFDPIVMDLGFVEPDGIRSVRYTLHNHSDQPRVINGIYPECSCTQVLRPPKEVPAHGETELVVDFHAPAEAMHYQKAILVRFGGNDKDAPTQRLQLTARIGLPLRAVSVDISLAPDGSKSAGTVTLANDGGQPVRLLYSTASILECSTTIPREPLGPSAQVIIPVNIDVHKSSRPGDGPLVLHFATNCPTQPTIDVPVRTGKPEAR